MCLLNNIFIKVFFNPFYDLKYLTATNKIEKQIYKEANVVLVRVISDVKHKLYILRIGLFF